MSFKLAEDYLLQHAYTNVWCTPEQDKQAVFQLARITPENGVWTNFTYHWRKIGLPVAKVRFHVYHIGQIHPSILGLLNHRNAWVPAPVAMESESVLIQVYNGRGTVVPKCLCWYLVTSDNNLLLAVRKSEQAPDLLGADMDHETLFMRLYSNAHFNKTENNIIPGVRVFSKRCNSALEIAQAQEAIAAWPAVGGVICYANGKVVNAIDQLNCKPGDYVEAVFDSSIKYVIEYNVPTLREFNSTLDNLRKYLLTHDSPTNSIDYMDDVDVFVISGAGSRWSGTYLHKNDSRTIRQVTHRDYSVAVARVQGAAQANTHLRDKSLRLRLVVRHSGYSRQLVMENSRLFELYKLNASERLDAMLGVNAHVDVWRAENLESSAYVQIMGATQGGITKDLVQKAYGYNALSVLLGDTPKRTVNIAGQNMVVIPEGLRGISTVYEYDSSGVMLTYDSITVDNTYTARSPNATAAEVVFGIADTRLDIQTGAIGTIDPHLSYRFYAAPAVGGVRTGEWQDVTDTPNYLVQSSQFQWVNTSGKLTRVVSNKRFLGYTMNIAPIAGVLEFDLVHYTSLGLEKFDIPLGHLDIFVNGYSLIEGVDFFIKKARVIITTKEYFQGGGTGTEEVTIRFMGFSDSQKKRELPEDTGFVYNGVISANKLFNLRDDKVLRIVVGGRLRLRSDLRFAEDGISADIANAENGLPYSIKDILVPMNRYLVSEEGCEDHTYHMREQSRAIDKQVSDYLTLKKPQAPDSATNAIVARHKLYSPFLARILSDLQTGALWQEKFIEHFGDDYVRKIVEPYAYLLDHDPVAGGVKVDTRYVVVHPHLEPSYVSLGMYQWRVLERIARLYTPGVDLSSTVSVLQF